MTPREQFKADILKHCLDKGMTIPEIYAFAKNASVASEGVEMVARILQQLAVPATVGAGAAAIGGPMLAGGAAGYGLAKMLEDDTDVDRIKADETISEFDRMTEQARRQSQMKNTKGVPTLNSALFAPR